METTSPENLEQNLATQLRKGYPIGELREDLLRRGFSERDADALLARLHRQALQRSAGRERTIPYIIFGLLFTSGLLELAMKEPFGYWSLALAIGYAVIKWQRPKKT